MSRRLMLVVAASWLALASCAGRSTPSSAEGDAEARVRAVRGRFGAIGPAAARVILRDGRVHAEVDKARLPRPATVTLPARANGSVALEDDASHLAIEFTLRGARDRAVAIASGIALYPRALPNADVLHRVQADGTEDFVVFEQRPAEEKLVYDVDVRRVAGLRLVGNTLEFLDASGTPRLRVAPPYVIDAEGVRHHAALGVDGCRYDEDPRAPWGRPVTAPSAPSCSVSVAWSEIGYPALVDPVWVTTGSMGNARVGHTARMLSSGKVLVVGGISSSVSMSFAELYDPASGTFGATGAMITPRHGHTMDVLSTGKLLVVGGRRTQGLTSYNQSTAELYDPTSGSFSATDNLSIPRWGHASSVLGSGKVLVTGGMDDPDGAPHTTAELYDPTSGKFTNGGAMTQGRSGHTSTVLPSGKVLIAAGNYSGQAELYDPAAKSFTVTGAMNLVRSSAPQAVLLSSGRVLVVGGATDARAELYDAASGTFTLTGATTSARLAGHTMTLLPSGKVLVAGSMTTPTDRVDLFDPATGSFASTAALSMGRSQHTATLLPSGKVLVAGGSNSMVTLSLAELYVRANGDPCATNADCPSSLCVDGVCCNSTCTGACEACNVTGAVGTCTPTAAKDPGSPACAPMVCNGTLGTCPATCANDDGCVSTHYCAADGSCKPRKTALGDACSDCKVAGCRVCTSGFCADGVCCDSACTGPCVACTAAFKGSGTDGTCGNVAIDTDPKSACPTDSAYPSSCGADGLCDGAGVCRSYAKAGTACGATTCAAGGVTGMVCSGDSATCKSTSIPCAPYVCGASACKTTCADDSDCVATASCTSAKTCVPRDLGRACAADADCPSGHCADGVCCNSACGGQCESCNEPGSEGTCMAVVGAPRGKRAACDALGSNECAKRACDGSARDRCDGYANGTKTPCGVAACSADKKYQSAGACDGHGKCATPEARNCAPYACDVASETGCKKNCAADADCAEGFTCNAGACVQGASCTADLGATIDKLGNTTPCAPFKCGPDGRCRDTCADSEQCAVGYFCDRGSQLCVAAAGSATADDGGCAYGAHRAAGTWFVGLMALAALIRRRAGRSRGDGAALADD